MAFGPVCGGDSLPEENVDHDDGRNHRDPVPPLPKRERDDG